MTVLSTVMNIITIEELSRIGELFRHREGRMTEAILFPHFALIVTLAQPKNQPSATQQRAYTNPRMTQESP